MSKICPIQILKDCTKYKTKGTYFLSLCIDLCIYLKSEALFCLKFVGVRISIKLYAVTCKCFFLVEDVSENFL